MVRKENRVVIRKHSPSDTLSLNYQEYQDSNEKFHKLSGCTLQILMVWIAWKRLSSSRFKLNGNSECYGDELLASYCFEYPQYLMCCGLQCYKAKTIRESWVARFFTHLGGVWDRYTCVSHLFISGIFKQWSLACSLPIHIVPI